MVRQAAFFHSLHHLHCCSVWLHKPEEAPERESSGKNGVPAAIEQFIRFG